MADQRYTDLESGGSIRVTEAIMRGSGPQGPKGDKGEPGYGTTIQGVKPTVDDIKRMRGDHEGEAWIAEENGHLYVWNQQLDLDGEDPWVDCGKIVGPPGQVQSIGAAFKKERTNYVRDDYSTIYYLDFDTLLYNDSEKITDPTGAITAEVPVISYDPGVSWTAWTYPNHGWTEIEDLPVHIIDVDIQFTAKNPDSSTTTREGPVTVRLFKNGNIEAENIEYMDAGTFNNATINLSWVGKTTGSDIFQVGVISGVPGVIGKARMQTARAGGGVGPQGPKGDQGVQGEQGQTGPVGPVGDWGLPAGSIMAFGGGPEDLPFYYERVFQPDQTDDSGNPIPESETDGQVNWPVKLEGGNPKVRLSPSWLPCDGSDVPETVKLRSVLGMKKTPDLRDRYIVAASMGQWEKQGRLSDADTSGQIEWTPSGDNTYWEQTAQPEPGTGYPYSGNNTLTVEQIPSHDHTVTLDDKEITLDTSHSHTITVSNDNNPYKNHTGWSGNHSHSMWHTHRHSEGINRVYGHQANYWEPKKSARGSKVYSYKLWGGGSGHNYASGPVDYNYNMINYVSTGGNHYHHIKAAASEHTGTAKGSHSHTGTVKAKGGGKAHHHQQVTVMYVIKT